MMNINNKNEYTAVEQYKKIFNTFNKLYFYNSLEIPVVKFTNKDEKYPVFNPKYLMVDNNKYKYMITLPIDILNEDIYEYALCILHAMIIHYSYINNLGYCSRNNTYFNKNFKNFANNIGIKCIYTKNKMGFKMIVDNTFKKICDDNKFKKDWGNVYVIKNQTLNKKNKNDNKSNKKGNNSIRYIDENGNIARTTKKHILFCLTDNPEIANSIEKTFGIYRMHN